MTSYEFYKCPSWVFPNAVVLHKDYLRIAVIDRIDWNKNIPEVYYTWDGDPNESRCLMTEFFGRFRPWWDAKGEQVTGMSSRSRSLQDAYDFSVRSLNIFEREGWSLMTLGEFVAKFTVEDLLKVRGLGNKVLNEIKECLAEAGLRMRFHAEDDE